MKKRFLCLLPFLALLTLCLCFAAGCGENETAHTEHVWGEFTITEAPTCTQTGKQVHTCTVCGYTEEKIAPALGHDYDEGKVTKPATCEEDGEMVLTCRNDASHTKTSKIPALGHDWKVKEVTKPATCTERGEQLMYCQNDESHTKTMEISPNGHSWGDWSWVEGKEGNCVTNGVRKHTCTVCSYTEEQNYIAKGHVWGEWNNEYAATCEEDGYIYRVCEECSAEEKTEQLKLGHNWGVWKIDVAPTCTTEGTKTRICSDCQKQATEQVPALDHDWTFTVKAQASKEAEGREEGKCSRCNETCTRVIPKLDAPKGIYRIVVSKTNGRQIITWKEDSSGKLYRYYRDEEGYVNYYTTEITLKNSKGEFVYKGNLIAQENYILTDTTGSWPKSKEVTPHLELELPIDDYTLVLGDIPEGYIYKSSYTIRKNSFLKIVPDDNGGDTQSNDESLSTATKATDPIDIYGNQIEDGQEKNLSASLSIVLTSQMSDGRLPQRTKVSVDGYKGGIFKGAILPDFSVKTVDGDVIWLSELMKGKKLVILDVYFYLCQFCQAAAPDFVRFAKEYEKDIAVICLNRQDSNVETCKRIYDQNDVYKYPSWFYCVMDHSSRFYFNIENDGRVGAPTQVVIDNGFCVADVLRGWDMEGYNLLLRNLPGKFNENMGNTGSGGSGNVSSLPAVLPEKKKLA